MCRDNREALTLLLEFASPPQSAELERTNNLCLFPLGRPHWKSFANFIQILPSEHKMTHRRLTDEQFDPAYPAEHPRNLIPELCRHFYNIGWATGTGGKISSSNKTSIPMFCYFPIPVFELKAKALSGKLLSPLYRLRNSDFIV